VLGISADPPEKQKKFKEKYDLPFTLLGDTGRKVSEVYGVLKEKNLYGKSSIGIERTTFLIGPEGKVTKVFPKVKAQGHAEEVLAELK
jgi:peroxiredoxin Q/BCP